MNPPRDYNNPVLAVFPGILASFPGTHPKRDGNLLVFIPLKIPCACLAPSHPAHRRPASSISPWSRLRPGSPPCRHPPKAAVSLLGLPTAPPKPLCWYSHPTGQKYFFPVFSFPPKGPREGLRCLLRQKDTRHH